MAQIGPNEIAIYGGTNRKCTSDYNYHFIFYPEQALMKVVTVDDPFYSRNNQCQLVKPGSITALVETDDTVKFIKFSLCNSRVY